MCYMQPLHHCVGDLLAGLVDPFEQLRGDRQPRRRGGVAQRPQHCLEAAQGLACPVETDLTEPAMLNRLPLRTARWIMTDRHRHPEPVAEVAWPLRLPQPGPTPITAPRIGQDQEVRGLGGGQAPVVLHHRAMAVTANSGVSAEAPT